MDPWHNMIKTLTKKISSLPIFFFFFFAVCFGKGEVSLIHIKVFSTNFYKRKRTIYLHYTDTCIVYFTSLHFTLLYFTLQITPLVHHSCDTLGKKLEKIAESGETVDMWR